MSKIWRVVSFLVTCFLIVGIVVTGVALITGASWEGTAAVLLAQGSRTQALPYSPIPGQFPGAGDVFTALFAGHILAGKDPAASAQAAMDTTALWISQSLCSPHAAIGLPVERYF